MVETDDGSVLRRNRSHLRDAPKRVTFAPDTSGPDDDLGAQEAQRGPKDSETPQAVPQLLNQPQTETVTRSGRVVRKPNKLSY